MDLVDRYVHAVKRHLPAAQQADIGSELMDDILSRMHDREAELGRPLHDDEQEAVLRHYGHPYLLAMRYRPQQHLIGPAVFPFYWAALKVTLAIALGIHIIVVVASSLAVSEPDRLLRNLDLLPVAIQASFWVTLVFAVLDFSQAKLNLLDHWSPRTLPPVTERTSRFQRAGLIAELVAGVLFLVWWTMVPRYPFLILGPAASFLTLSPAWHRVYLLAAVPSAISVLILAWILAFPSRTWLARWRPVVVNLLTIGALAVLLNAGDLVVPLAEGFDRAQAVRAINTGIRAVLGLISVITVINTVHEAIRLIRAARV